MHRDLTRIATVLFATAALVLGCASTDSAKKPDADAAAAAQAPKVRMPEDEFRAALADFDAGKYKDALEGFERVLKKAPRTTNAQFNIGLTYERMGNLEKAQAAYEAAQQLDPMHEPTLLNLGRLLRVQGRYADAVAMYEKALAAPGNEYDVELLNNLAVAQRLAKDYVKAEAAARKVLSRTKNNPEAYKNLSLIYYDQGNYKLAEFISHNARKLDDKDPGVYNNLGMVYLKLDERQRALAQFQKAVQLNDAFAPGHLNIGAMALAYRDYTTAEKSFAKALSLDPTSYEALLYLAYALDGQKGRDPKKGLTAGETFEKALALRPGQPDAVCGAGWAFSSDRAGWDKALSYLEKCKATSLPPEEIKAVDQKLQTLVAMKKGAAPQQPANEKPREAPKPSGGGEKLLEQVSQQAAQSEPEQAAPAQGAPAAPAAPGAEGAAPKAP